MFANADEVLRYIKDEDVEFVDVRFCDLPGVMQHFNVPAQTLDRGLLHRRPDVRRLLDPRLPGHPRVGHEAAPGPHDRLPRPVPGREDAEPELLRSTTRSPTSRTAATRATSRRRPRRTCAATGIADTAYFGAEAEFYIFDDVRFETKQNAGFYYIDSIEGAWNTGREEEGGNRGYKTRYKGGYFPVPPVDHYADLRDEMCVGTGRAPASRSSAATTRSAPPARPRSTTSSTPCCTPPTT